ncbi:MAG: AAA family ATPase, partial [Lachnospiraceae bacterium]|nr:AAA family ATPase [Lachnospiraceae bacterium]
MGERTESKKELIDLKDYGLAQGIAIIDEINTISMSFEHRDVYYDIVKCIKNMDYTGKVICLSGLRRTGKSTILNQLYAQPEQIGLNQDNILYIKLSAISSNGQLIDRDSLDIKKVNNRESITYPSLVELQKFLNRWDVYKDSTKCILIDEVTLCKDLIMSGKGLIDQLIDSGKIVILAGTESASFHAASEQALYTRLMIKDTSYIPFGEYCRLKRLPLNTLEEKQNAMNKYIEHGNILDNIQFSEEYIESAIGINLALSIIQSDYDEFISFPESCTKDLVQDIIKYYKLIGENISIQSIREQITRGDLSRAINNENSRRKKQGKELVRLAKADINRIVKKGAEKVFHKYDMDLGISRINLNTDQLYKIDSLFGEMGLIYDINIVPELNKRTNGSVQAEDVCIVNSLSMLIGRGIMQEIADNCDGLNEDDKKILIENMESALKGRILESVIAAQYLKGYEQKNELKECLVYYSKNGQSFGRKCARYKLYKYNNEISVGNRNVKAEIDLIK